MSRGHHTVLLNVLKVIEVLQPDIYSVMSFTSFVWIIVLTVVWFQHPSVPDFIDNVFALLRSVERPMKALEPLVVGVVSFLQHAASHLSADLATFVPTIRYDLVFFLAEN